MVDFNALADYAGQLVIQYAPKFILAIIVLVVGWKIIGWFVKKLGRRMTKRKMDASLKHFLESLIGILLKVMLVISVAAMIGIETTSFIAVLGAAGLAIGLALQGSLANFAGGALILTLKPFEVGDFIKAQGELGTVKKIEIFNTYINTPDNQVVVIPNGILSNGVITNYSKEDTRRIDLTFGIGYDDDANKAKKILQKIADKHKAVLKDPEHFIRVTELADSSVNISFRVWTKSADWWGTRIDILEEAKSEFDKNEISIPYPQMDLHMQK